MDRGQRKTRLARTRFVKRVLFAALAVWLLSAAGCAGDGNAGQTDEAGTANGGQTADGRATGPAGDGTGLPETPPEDDPDLPFDEQLVSLAETGAPVADLLKFVRVFADQASPAEMSAMLRILEEKQLEQVYALEDRFYEDPAVQEELFGWYIKLERLPRAEDLPDGPAKRLLEDAEAGGYKVETAEGLFFPVLDYAVYKAFRSRATEDMQAYIDLMARESDEPAVKDAALIIPWEEVARRALDFESFVAAYPDSPRAAMADRLRKDYTYITFKGVDNSPLFEREGGAMVEAALAAFKKVMAENGNGQSGARKNGNGKGIGNGGKDAAAESRYLSDLREFVRLVEAGGGRQTDAVRAFQDKVTEGLLDDYEKRYEDMVWPDGRTKGRSFLFGRPLI